MNLSAAPCTVIYLEKSARSRITTMKTQMGTGKCPLWDGPIGRREQVPGGPPGASVRGVRAG